MINYGYTDKEVSDCCCGSNRLLFVRADLPKMKDVAIKFEEEVNHDKSRGCNRSNKVHFRLTFDIFKSIVNLVSNSSTQNLCRVKLNMMLQRLNRVMQAHAGVRGLEN